MSFTSMTFLILFFPACILGHFFIKDRWRNTFLCIASLIFYAWCGLQFLILLMALVLINYAMGIWLEKEEEKKQKKVILIIGIVIDLTVLCCHKWFRLSALGISFYTFSFISYLMDIYWERCRAQRKIMCIMLYVAFFPKVIQGPIMLYADFEKQLQNRVVSLEGINGGAERFIKGMFKKVMIADHLQKLVSYSFSNIGSVGTIPAWIGAIVYLFQLYYDFSGYSDMAIGLGEMVGFVLPENFAHPYMSASMVEYWKRWHASLGIWFREYVYMPCFKGLVRRKWIKRRKAKYEICDLLALLVTWIFTGIWHGTGLQFLAFGLWNYAFIILERAGENHHKKMKKLGKSRIKERSNLESALRHIAVVLIVLVSSVFFRADSLYTALRYIKRMVIWSNADGILMLHQFNNYIVFILLLSLIFIFPIYEKIKSKCEMLCSRIGKYSSYLVVYRIGLLVAFFLSFCYIASNGYSSFMYEIF